LLNIIKPLMMKIRRIITFLFLLDMLLLSSGCSVQKESSITPVRLTCEYLKNPSVVDVLNPRLSWINIINSGERGQYQTAYQIQVSSSLQFLNDNNPDIWDSERVDSDRSFLVEYDGAELNSNTKYWWHVRVWDCNGIVSDWSEPASWNMGILEDEEWKAEWIGAPWQGDQPMPELGTGGNRRTGENQKPVPPPAPLLRKTFRIDKKIISARAYVTGLGFFELYVNGKKVSQDVLVPNLTLYGKRPWLENNYIPIPDDFKEYRIMYLSYDIKEMLTNGENTIGAILGNGFYDVNSRWTDSYGSPRFIGQVYIIYEDGTEDLIISDKSWKASKGPIVFDQIYEGEHYDARLEQQNWCSPGFDDSEWEYVAQRKKPEAKMKAHMSPTDRVMEKLSPVLIESMGDGKYRVDFGQEISGWLHLLDITGDPGHKIDIKYICESPVGSNSYTMKGGGPESYAARFTWFVFREVELSNWPGELKPEQLVAEAVYTDVETTGKFESSDTLFDQINRIWWRSQTDNMHGGIASDCPHRERSPYTGDGQVSCVTVMHNFDARAFYTKWIHDIVGAQIPETGYVPNGAPWQPGCGGGVAWGAAICIMPWEFYLHYGDLKILSDTYEGMKGYIRYMLTWTRDDGTMFSQAPDTANPNRWLNLGDWCAPGDLPPDDMVHTFYLWRCADYTSKTATALGYDGEAKTFADMAEKTKKAFQNKYYDQEKGTYGPHGGNIFALAMGVPSDQYQRVIEALKSDISSNDGHLDTGIFGTQYFFEVLAANGLNNIAFEAMNKRTEPSYGWWLAQGATTTWERWDGGGSRNHPMFGGGLVWFYRVLSGMKEDPSHPGYSNIIFRPQPVTGIDYSSYSNLTPNGEAGIKWEYSNNMFLMDIIVPAGSTATVYVPVDDIKTVRENGKKIKLKTKDIKYKGTEEDYAVYLVQSGEYNFSSVISLEQHTF
jgi:alpha-L-rhamnosidase